MLGLVKSGTLVLVERLRVDNSRPSPAGCRSRLRGLGGLISEGWKLDRLVRSRVGDTKAAALEDEEAGTAGRDFGDGSACDERCSAGDDRDANLREGVI